MDMPIHFLFRKQGKGPPPSEAAIPPLPLRQRIIRGKKQRVQSTQWTARLAALVDSHRPDVSTQQQQQQQGDRSPDVEKAAIATFLPQEIGIDVAVRLEGPYFSPADPSRYDTVVCLVAGTGISGAIAIAAAFNHAALNDTTEAAAAAVPTRKWRRCAIIWSVKESDDIDLSPFLDPKADGFELRKCLTGPGRSRVDLERTLSDICSQGRTDGHPCGGRRSWVYISGPNKFIESGKEACRAVKRLEADLDFYAASWEI